MNKLFSLLILGLLAVFNSFNSRAAEPSKTVPIIYIETENHKPIADKVNYIKASYKIVPYGNENVDAEEGTLQIRGRGNYTWDWFEKKPYKLKLDDKSPLLGFNKSKHFVLLAHADDNLGFMREPMGFKMSELAGMPWTPGQKPVELVLNGDYRGLYFLVENIRIAKDRVNIFDQEEEEESTDVTGGWLCELDNYELDPSEQISIREGNGDKIRITHHSPEIINDSQREFLRSQMEALDKAFYDPDPNSREFEKLVDLNTLVNFYVLQEIMDGQESFHGSCYLFRDRGENEKWYWGPVWDFGNTFLRAEGNLIYENPDWGQTWIDQIVKFKSFQENYKYRFQEFIDNEYEEVQAYIRDYSASLKDAAIADAERWPQYGNRNITQKAEELLELVRRRITFLCYRWGMENELSSGLFLRGDFNGWAVDWDREFEINENGDYYFEGKNFSGRFKIADYGWNPENWGTKIVNQEIPLNTPVELINGPESKDMVSPGGFESILFKIIEPGKKATIELLTTNSKVDETFSSPGKLEVLRDGNRIYTREGSFSVFNINGIEVGNSVNSITLPPGIYIVKRGAETIKLLIK